MGSHGIKDQVAIIGMGCTRFGERWDTGTDDMLIEASNEAYESAGIAPEDVDAYWLGTAMSGTSGMDLAGPLKLDKARFTTHIETVELAQGGPSGIDRVAFWVGTNPGTDPGPLMKVASGGELARFILALKVVLAARGSAPTLIFDEADSGVGGATAAAVGERLARLAEGVQVLAVTHAPQVAAVANGHLLIAKEPVRGKDGEAMATRVAILAGVARREEIARMLAGQTITDEARKAAERLMKRTA